MIAYRYYLRAPLVNMIACRYFLGMKPADTPTDPRQAVAAPPAPQAAPVPSSSDLAAEMIIHLARLAQSGETEPRLTAAQWTALRFFARANRLSRTPSAFSAFHATTRGTASQTVKSLVALGLLERHRNEDDGRSIRFELTAEGQDALRQDPVRMLGAVLDGLDPDRRQALVSTLTAAAGALAQQRDAAQFGTCTDCAHCESAESGQAPAFCRCADATLLAGDMDALCIAFVPRLPGGRQT